MQELQKVDSMHWKLYKGQEKEKDKKKKKSDKKEEKGEDEVVTWEMNGASAKTMAMEAFVHDDNCRVFITTFGTSAHGVDLQIARNLILAEAVYNPGKTTTPTTHHNTPQHNSRTHNSDHVASGGSSIQIRSKEGCLYLLPTESDLAGRRHRRASGVRYLGQETQDDTRDYRRRRFGSGESESKHV